MTSRISWVSWFSFWPRFIGVFAFFAAPVLFTGTILFGLAGGLAGSGIVLLSLIWIAVGSELGLRRIHPIEGQVSGGLARTFNSVVQQGRRVPEKQRKSPRLFIYSDPVPNALVIRSLGGKGTILLSQGIVSFLRDEEIRAVLEVCVERLEKPGILYRSFCSYLASGILKLAPTQWNHLVFERRSLSPKDEPQLSPINTIVFLIFFPAAQYLVNRGRFLEQDCPSARSREAYVTALQKIGQNLQGKRPRGFSGTLCLSCIHPC